MASAIEFDGHPHPLMQIASNLIGKASQLLQRAPAKNRVHSRLRPEVSMKAIESPPVTFMISSKLSMAEITK